MKSQKYHGHDARDMHADFILFDEVQNDFGFDRAVPVKHHVLNVKVG